MSSHTDQTTGDDSQDHRFAVNSSLRSTATAEVETPAVETLPDERPEALVPRTEQQLFSPELLMRLASDDTNAANDSPLNAPNGGDERDASPRPSQGVNRVLALLLVLSTTSTIVLAALLVAWVTRTPSQPVTTEDVQEGPAGSAQVVESLPSTLAPSRPAPPPSKGEPTPAAPLSSKAPRKRPRARPKPGETCEVEIAPGVMMTFCWIPAGDCQLGAPPEEHAYIVKHHSSQDAPTAWIALESYKHRGVFKTSGFWLGKYEVTQAEWAAVMGRNPSDFNGKNKNEAIRLDTSRFPVETVSWDEICGTGKFKNNGFLNKINNHGDIQKAFGRPGQFRLPTENQWEYACRGGFGNDCAFYYGNHLNGDEANCQHYFPYGVQHRGEHLNRTCAVDFTNEGKYPRHPWGLMHMHGNLREFCDGDSENIKNRPSKGGSWTSNPVDCRAAARDWFLTNYGANNYGLRVIIRLD